MRGSFVLWALVLALVCVAYPQTGKAAETKSDHALQGTWDEAVRALSRENYPEALELFSRWQADAREMGIESSELHYNLGITHLNLKQNGPAAFHLMKSARMSDSPLRVWRTLEAVSHLQRGIGVKENFVDSPLLRLSYLVSPNLTWVLAAIAIWSLVAAILFIWWQAHWTSMASLFTLLGIMFGLLSCAGWMNRRYFSQPAVLIAASTDVVSVYNQAQAKKENLLVDLPSGTVVNLTEVRGELSQIDAPIAGWIASSDVRSLTP